MTDHIAGNRKSRIWIVTEQIPGMENAGSGKWRSICGLEFEGPENAVPAWKKIELENVAIANALQLES